MKFELPRNSLFAILLRSRWWLSVLLALGVFALARLVLPVGVAAFLALPFLAIGIHAAFRQLRRPSAKRIAARLERARALPWDGFCAALEEGFRRGGYSVSRTNGGADLELTHEGRITLVACKRWKAVRTGIEPLREFHGATTERGAHSRVYVAAGEITANALAFAVEKQIRLLQDEELAKLLEPRKIGVRALKAQNRGQSPKS
jgi:restriction system protein